MLKNIAKIVTILILIFFMIFILVKTTFAPENNNNNNIENVLKEENTSTSTNSYISQNGWLSVNNTKLVNEKNEEIQLAGISSHGIQWFSDIITYDNLKYFKDKWKINVFRVAMYSENYISNPNLKQTLTEIVDKAIDLDMYVIIDWHILSDNNPNTYIEQSNNFFNEMSLKYKDTPNIIYEICNEPNGSNVTWEKDIKPYAEKIIPTIRKNSPKSLIIVGTPDWSKDLKSVADSPLNFENITYACHFYSGTHGQELQESIDYALNKNISIFVSECGLTDASGNGALYYDKFNSWIKFLDERKISWVCWSFSNKNESSAIVLPDYKLKTNKNENNNSTINTKSDTYELEDYLSNSGNFLKNLFMTR